MKTYKNLFSQIVTFENLLQAYKRAAKGKRERDYVLRFTFNLEENLFQLQSELIQQTYRPGLYSTFQIYRPKARVISAAPFRDRVVHHALVDSIGPLLEKSYIYDSYANRKAKGTHRAIRRYHHYLRNYSYVLKCDIKKYFPSIDHNILKKMIATRIADPRTLNLIETIIDSSNPQEFVPDYFPGDVLFTPMERKKGLPIGNLTSQCFANFYLNPFDHFVKEILRCHAYLRYVDDFVLFSDSKEELQDWHIKIEHFLESYRLRLNPKRKMLFPSRIPISFLGQVIHHPYRRLRGENVRRLKKRLWRWEWNPPENVFQRIWSWIGHAQQADTKGLLNSLGYRVKKDSL